MVFDRLGSSCYFRPVNTDELNIALNLVRLFSREKTLLLLISIILVGSIDLSAQNLVINEWLAKNDRASTDEDGDFSDWLELYNGTSSPIDLDGFGISDSEDEPYGWVFPETVLPPNGFLLVFCSGKDRVIGPYLHTNFKLKAGETIALTHPSGTEIDSQECTLESTSISEGRYMDGQEEIRQFYQATPGSSNANGVLHSQVEASHETGFYGQPFLLEVSGTESHNIRFTIDGSQPDIADQLWTETIQITDRSNQPNGISKIPTNASDQDQEWKNWEPPANRIFKGTVLRFRSFDNYVPSSDIIERSFFVHPKAKQRFEPWVVSLVTDSPSLFDYDTGIYVPGATYDASINAGDPLLSGNYNLPGDEWERKCHVEIINTSGEVVLSQNLGMRIHGAGSRSQPQKSIRLYAREEYGEDEMHMEPFPDKETDEFEVVILRNMGQGYRNGVALDVFANKLIEPMDIAYSSSRPIVSFINGEYWGIQNLRERFDKHYLSELHELHKDSIDIIDGYYGSVEKGDDVAFNHLFHFIDMNDLSVQVHYNHVDSLMDIPDFIDNTLTRIFVGSYDWPGNNVKMWRERSSNGKFRWLQFDNDDSFVSPDFNTLKHATEANHQGWPNPPESTLFLRNLLENNEFKEVFVSRMTELLKTTFARERATNLLTEIYNNYAPLYEEHDQRWQVLENGNTLEENYIDAMEFLRLRACNVAEHFKSHFNLTDQEFSYECDSTAINVGMTGPKLLHLYPNPNQGTFTIDLPSIYTESAYLKLTDVAGRQVYQTDLRHIIGPTQIIHTENLKAGVYSVSLKVGTNRYWARMVLLK